MNIFQKKQTDVMEVYYLDIIQLTQTNRITFRGEIQSYLPSFTLPCFY